MKKIFFFLIIAIPVLTQSCSEDGDGNKGAIILSSKIVGNSSLQLSDIHVAVEGQDASLTTAWPADNTIENLPSGDYTVTATTHPDGMPAPAFNTPYWAGQSVIVTVSENKNTIAALELSQLNGGVFFGYPAPSDMDVIYTLTDQSGQTLAYEGNRTEAGYFAPGNLTLTAVYDGVPVIINGKESASLTVSAGRYCRVNLENISEVGGSLSVSATFEDMSYEEQTMVIGEGGGDSLFTIEELTGVWSVTEVLVVTDGQSQEIFYNDHEVVVVMEDETTLKSHNTLALEALDAGVDPAADIVTINVDLKKGTVNIPIQMSEPSYDIGGWPVYFCRFIDKDYGQCFNYGFYDIPIIRDGAGYLIDFADGGISYGYITATGEALTGSFVPLTKDPSGADATVYSLGNLYFNTIWTKSSTRNPSFKTQGLRFIEKTEASLFNMGVRR